MRAVKRWRSTPWSCLCLAAIACGAASSKEGVAPATLAGRDLLTAPGREWKLIWSDEFNGDRLDASKWSIGLSWTGDDGTNRHHNEQYASYIMDDDVVVKGGVLSLLTRRRDVTNPSGKPYHYTEGLIQTNGKFRATSGYFEVRARIPVEAGPGMWPAFWMLPDGWPPEMDILEVWTASNRNHQGLAFRKPDGGVGWDDTNDEVPLPTGFHTFGMEWGPGYQIYNQDGRVRKTVYGEHVPSEPMYIILNNGIESANPPTRATAFPNAFDVDYVRVYQRQAGARVMNAGFEADDAAPWKLDRGALVSNDSARSGRRALRIDRAPASCEQRIFGLKPGTTYTLTAWARAALPGDEARVGVKDYGGPEAYKVVTSQAYEKTAVTFSTGLSATSATVYADKPSGEGAAFFDDFEIQPAVAGQERVSMVRPGEIWRDTDGRPIQAHGGGLLKHNGVWYWYGEEKSLGGGNRVGVACYSSRDLLNWENRGVVLPKGSMPEVFQDQGVCERPKVLYNKKTRRFVMWMHLDANGYSVAEAGVAVADRPEGPFRLVSHFRPVPESTYRDMALFQDEDGKAYAFYAGEGNATMHVVRLNDEYTAPEQPMVEGKTWSRIFVGQSREAPAPFRYGNRYYVITSACTGWAPNSAEYAVADDILGPWRNMGTLCVGPEAATTFRSQSTYVLPAPGQAPGSFIYLGDRWVPDNLGDSRYIWLPFRVADDGTITLPWRDQWNWSAFPSENASKTR